MADRTLDCVKDVRLLDDGFGNIWEMCDRKDCALEIVRPGKVQCGRCEEAAPYDIARGYRQLPQPQTGSEK